MKHRVRKKQTAALLPVPIRRVLLAAFLALPAAVRAAPPPDWVTRGVEAVYPREAYIAVTGRGKTAKLAEKDADAALSLYCIAEVTTVSRSRQTLTSDTGLYARLDSETFVHSVTRLFALRHTAPWYDRGEKTYTVAAYIDRAEAWAIFEPRVRREAEEFRALWRAAESETAALKSYFDYKRALEHTRRGDFVNTMNFGEILYPQKMNALAGDIRQNIARLGAKLNEARNMAAVFIQCPVDFESAVSTALARLLSAEGLPVTADKRRAAAICTARVDEGFQRVEGTGYFYYPRISVIITDRSGNALFSYSAAPGKQAAMNPEVAKRRAYGELAAALESDFSGEMNRQLGVR
ncbi:MAG: hypothetical protein LBG84_09895 [Treponema sp.]|jgi:hypothetical protein|nr:hypothetical protein [Treponema sp.]